MSNPIHLELATPERVLVNKPVAMVTVPGEQGLYSVLAGHAPMITTVCSGVVELYENDDTSVTERIFIEKGFAEVTESRCTVLAEKAMPVKTLDRAAVEAEIAAINDEIAGAATADDVAAIEPRLITARAKLQAIS